jgi:hypothetical protein
MEVEAISDENVVLRLAGGPRIYSYSLKDDVLTIETADPWTLKVERRWAMLEYNRVAEITGLGVGGLFATVLEYQTVLMRIPVPSKFRYVKYGLYLVAAGVGVSGGYVGYYLSYDDKADYGNPTFKRVLEDKSTWKQYAQRLLQCRAIEKSNTREQHDSLLAEADKKPLGPASKNLAELPRCAKYHEWIRGRSSLF